MKRKHFSSRRSRSALPETHSAPSERKEFFMNNNNLSVCKRTILVSVNARHLLTAFSQDFRPEYTKVFVAVCPHRNHYLCIEFSGDICFQMFEPIEGLEPSHNGNPVRSAIALYRRMYHPKHMVHFVFSIRSENFSFFLDLLRSRQSG